MNLARMNMRRLTTVAAAAAAAVLVPTIALAAAGGPAAAGRGAAPRAHAASTRCRSGYLTDWLALPGDAEAGSISYMVEISNTSGATCTLYGFPGVSAVAADGHQLGSPAARDYGWTELPLTLQPYDTVHFVLQIGDAYNYPPATCHPAAAYGLRVYAPGDYSSKIIPFRFEACSRRGPVFMLVSTTLMFTGIPGVGN